MQNAIFKLISYHNKRVALSMRHSLIENKTAGAFIY